MLTNGRLFYGWIMLIAVALMTFSSSGARFSFSVFVIPMEQELGWTRSQLSNAAALNLLCAGLFRTLAGFLADRFGSKAVATGGLAVAALALILTSQARELWQFFLTFGVLLSVGYAFASPVTTTTLVSRWFVSRRALALSLGSLGSSLGELSIVPLAALSVAIIGWQASYRVWALFIGLIVLPVGLLLLRDRPEDVGLEPLGSSGPARGRAADGRPALSLREAAKLPDFWRLTLGFFVCGFTMSFASTHFVPFAMDMGFEPMVAANALGLVGLCAIGGSLTTGLLGDRLGRKNVLAAVYLLRGLSFAALLHAHHDPLALYVGALLLGVSWTSTGPLTSAITADRCGLSNLGKIYGTMYMVMPIGSAVGAALAGQLHDLTGGYALTLGLSTAAGLVAAVVVSGVRGGPSVPKVGLTPERPLVALGSGGVAAKQ